MKDELKMDSKRFEKVMAGVLRAFPELENIEIETKETSGMFAYASRPDFRTIFRKPENRKYLILINNSPKNGLAEMHPNKISDKALSGILAHELSHTVYYLNKSWFGFLGFGILYFICPPFRKRIEHNTDYEAIKRGFGAGLYEFRERTQEKIKGKAGKHLKKYYLSAEEVLEATPENKHQCGRCLEFCLDCCKKYEGLISFSFITGLGNLIDIVLFYLLYDLVGWNIWPANILAFGSSVIWNFFVSRNVSFKTEEKKTAKRFGKYSLTAVISYFIDTFATIYLLKFGLLSPLAKLFAGWVTFIWSYSANKFWTFRK